MEDSWSGDRSRSSVLKLLVALALVATTGAALAVVYYFAASLPAFNRERLALERQKYMDEQRQREASAAATATKEAERQSLLQSCLDESEKSRLAYLRLNGTVTAKGTISTNEVVVKSADARKKNDTDACFQQFRK